MVKSLFSPLLLIINQVNLTAEFSKHQTEPGSAVVVRHGVKLLGIMLKSIKNPLHLTKRQVLPYLAAYFFCKQTQIGKL